MPRICQNYIMISLKHRHMEALKAGMESLRNEDKLTDLEVVINHRIFRCHKSMLVAMSPYFRAMFNTGMRESTQKRITLQDIEETPFEKFLEFVYRGEVDLLDEDVIEMLRLAALFQVDCLQSHCEDILLEQLCADNCLELFRLSCMYYCDRLKKRSWPAILDGFCTIWKSEDFTCLSADEVIAVIRDDSLVTLDEEHVCEAMMKWINTDLPKRKDYIFDIFKHVRLPHVAPEYLVNNLYKTPCLVEDDKCRKLLEETQHYHMLPARRLDYSGARLRYRTDDDLEEVLLVITDNSIERGSFYQVGWCLWAFSFAQKRWFTLAPIPVANSPGIDFSICSHGYDIFLSGGANNPKSLLKFESERNEWVTCTGQLKKGRCQHSMVSVGNALYSIGGRNIKLTKSSQIMGSVEEYYIPGQRWRSVGELPHPAHSAAAAVCGEQILIFGGIGKTGTPMSCVQCFHCRTKETSIISNMPCIPKRLLSITIGNTIYITSMIEDGHCTLKMNADFGFTDAGFDIPTDRSLLGVSHHDENMIILTDTPDTMGIFKNIMQINLDTSQAEVLAMKGNMYPKPVHGCHRSYIDKRFLYHTYFQ